ncbi:MAG: hypothetical protein ABI634_14060 [Acidobacteriota bacterium]
MGSTKNTRTTPKPPIAPAQDPPPAVQTAARNPVREARATQKRSTVPSGTASYVARRPFTYDGTELDRDQIFTLTGQPNDEALVRLGYVKEFTGAPIACGECGHAFGSAGALQHHGTLRHRPQEDQRPVMAARQPGESDFDYDRRRDAFERAVVAQEESKAEADEAALEQARPLNWQNTRATREAEL